MAQKDRFSPKVSDTTIFPDMLPGETNAYGVCQLSAAFVPSLSWQIDRFSAYLSASLRGSVCPWRGSSPRGLQKAAFKTSFKTFPAGISLHQDRLGTDMMRKRCFPEKKPFSAHTVVQAARARDVLHYIDKLRVVREIDKHIVELQQVRYAVDEVVSNVTAVPARRRASRRAGSGGGLELGAVGRLGAQPGGACSFERLALQQVVQHYEP